ncbi:MAG: hypothetical protein HY552_06455 [Elusimicrobia bacterium]|nr:hypothetical protein [Elusimicrobiota bacterium]
MANTVLKVPCGAETMVVIGQAQYERMDIAYPASLGLTTLLSPSNEHVAALFLERVEALSGVNLYSRPRRPRPVVVVHAAGRLVVLPGVLKYPGPADAQAEVAIALQASAAGPRRPELEIIPITLETARERLAPALRRGDAAAVAAALGIFDGARAHEPAAAAPADASGVWDYDDSRQLWTREKAARWSLQAASLERGELRSQVAAAYAPPGVSRPIPDFLPDASGDPSRDILSSWLAALAILSEARISLPSRFRALPLYAVRFQRGYQGGARRIFADDGLLEGLLEPKEHQALRALTQELLRRAGALNRLPVATGQPRAIAFNRLLDETRSGTSWAQAVWRHLHADPAQN